MTDLKRNKSKPPRSGTLSERTRRDAGETTDATSRRAFLRAGAGGLGLGLGLGLSGAGSAWRRPEWMQEAGAPFSAYGQPAEAERDVIRWPVGNRAAPGNGVSWCPLHALEGTVTPNGLHFERHHNGVPRIDPAHHRLLLHGLVRRPLWFSLDALLRYPLRSQLCFLECGGNSNAAWNKTPLQTAAGYLHGLASCAEWSGVPLSLLLREAGMAPGAAWVIAEGADGFAHQVSIPLAKAMDDALLALYQNGERLRPENGYPLRLLLPGWEGVLSVKWLRRLEISDRPLLSRNETARYSDLLPSGKARRFSFPMEVKSLLTSPSAGMRLPGQGFYTLSGLAWSGRGRIRRVRVSMDGGRHWQTAELQQPVLKQCFTRFRLPWRWGGGPALLLSRAEDDTGRQQPMRAELIARRGRNSYYHYNAVVAWRVHENGEVSHAYADAAPDPAATGIDAPWN